MAWQRLSYGDAVAISWAMNWRLAIANLILMLVLAAVFGFLPATTSRGTFSFGVWFAADLLLIWPFVLRRVLESRSSSLRLSILSNTPQAETLTILYRKAILLALVVEAVTLLLSFLTVLVLGKAGMWTSRDQVGTFNLLAGLLRLLVVMPIGIKLFASEERVEMTGNQASGREIADSV